MTTTTAKDAWPASDVRRMRRARDWRALHLLRLLTHGVAALALVAAF